MLGLRQRCTDLHNFRRCQSTIPLTLQRGSTKWHLFMCQIMRLHQRDACLTVDLNYDTITELRIKFSRSSLPCFTAHYQHLTVDFLAAAMFCQHFVCSCLSFSVQSWCGSECAVRAPHLRLVVCQINRSTIDQVATKNRVRSGAQTFNRADRGSLSAVTLSLDARAVNCEHAHCWSLTACGPGL